MSSVSGNWLTEATKKAVADREGWLMQFRAANISVPRFTVHNIPEGLISGSAPVSAYQDASGIWRDSCTLRSYFKLKCFADFFSHSIFELVDLVLRMEAAAAFFQNTDEEQTYVYALLAHTAMSGAVNAHHIDLSAQDLIRPFVEKMQQPAASNKHLILMPDTCFGSNYGSALQQFADSISDHGSSVILQTSSGNTEAQGNAFVPLWRALQEVELRAELVAAFRAYNGPPVRLTAQQPALLTAGQVVWLDSNHEFRQDSRTKLCFFHDPAFFHFSLALLFNQNFLAPRTWQPAMTPFVAANLAHLTILGCKTKQDSWGHKLAIFAIQIPPMSIFLTAHLHVQHNQISCINLFEANMSVGNSSAWPVQYVMEDDKTDSHRERMLPGHPLFLFFRNFLVQYGSQVPGFHYSSWDPQRQFAPISKGSYVTTRSKTSAPKALQGAGASTKLPANPQMQQNSFHLENFQLVFTRS